MLTFEQMHEKNKITPIVYGGSLENIVTTAKILLEHDINIVEIGLTIPGAFKIIEAVSNQVPDIVIGAANTKSAGDFLNAYNAGADYIVSPGCTSELFVAARSHRSLIRYQPGVVTPSEAMFALNEGFSVQKFFPFEDYNGYRVTQSISELLPEIKFCITGGIHKENLTKYISLKNVLAVSIKYITDRTLIEDGNFEEIEKRAKEIIDILKKEPQPLI